MDNDNTLLTVKEVAVKLKRSPAYVYKMKRAGFTMTAGRATLSEAICWLKSNPDFKTNKSY